MTLHLYEGTMSLKEVYFMELGEAISFYRRKADMTIDELAEKSGVPKSTINKIIGGITKAPTLDNIKAIAKALGIRLSDLDEEPELLDSFSASEQNVIKKYRTLDEYGKEAVDGVLETEHRRCREQAAATSLLDNNVLPLRCSTQSASAGTGCYLGPEEWETIHVLENDLTRRASFCVPVSGDSMEPKYHDKDILVIDDSAEVEPGQIGLYTIDGDGFVKIYGGDHLVALNPAYPKIPLTEDTRCNGKVIGVLEPGWIVEG